MKFARIRHISFYLPESTLGNKELVETFSGWTEEKIVRKLGIETRPIAAPGETSVDMAVKAIEKFFASGAAVPEEIDFLLLCTQSPDYFLPTSACVVQDRTGLPKTCGALDFNLGCSGYVYGLALAKGLVETGLAKKILLVTSETYSKYINERDRGTRPLFGDGAAVTYIVAEEQENSEAPIGPFLFGTDGSGADMLIVPAGAHRLPSSPQTAKEQVDSSGSYRSKDQIFMHGPGIFMFAVDTVPVVLEELLEKSGKTKDEIGYFVFHQANRYMLSRLRELCDIEESKYFCDIMHRGNTVSSTLPIALADAKKQGILPLNVPIMLLGFGVGLSWGATLVTLSEDFMID